MSNTNPDFEQDEFLLDHFVGKTPLVRLQRLASHTQATVLAKLEGNNPAGSVKDRPAYNMIMQAEKRGQIKPGDTLIEATSGNTGIALAMVAAMRGYKMKLIMPASSSQERKDAMRAYGAELIESENMEQARDMAQQMEKDGIGLVLNQFGNPDNVQAHYLTTGPEIWEQTGGKITHFVSSMGTTGTIMGISKYLKEKNPNIQIVGLQPSEGSNIAGIRRWPKEYLPTILMHHVSIRSWIFHKLKRRKLHVVLHVKRVLAQGHLLVAQSGRLFSLRNNTQMLLLCVLYVTVVIVTCLQVYSL